MKQVFHSEVDGWVRVLLLLTPVLSLSAVGPVLAEGVDPALSLNRLEISYAGGRKIMVSPRERERFLRALSPA